MRLERMVVKKRIFGFSAHKNVIGFGRNDGLGQWIRKQLRVPELPLHFGPGTSVTSPLRGGFELRAWIVGTSDLHEASALCASVNAQLFPRQKFATEQQRIAITFERSSGRRTP